MLVRARPRAPGVKRRVQRTLLGVGAAVVLAVAAVGYIVLNQVDPGLPQSLAALGPTRLTSAAGSPVRLSAAVQPRSATLLAFWATWCVPCREEATEIAALRRHYAASELSIVYLNVDELPNAAATAAFLRAAHAENLPVLYAGHAGWTAITGSRTMVLPRSYLFGRSGAATAVFPGFGKDSKRQLERGIAKALAG